jgi:hypothetical protein
MGVLSGGCGNETPGYFPPTASESGVGEPGGGPGSGWVSPVARHLPALALKFHYSQQGRQVRPGPLSLHPQRWEEHEQRVQPPGEGKSLSFD